MYVIRPHDGPKLLLCKELDFVVHDSAFTGSCSAIISDSCDYVGTYVGVLIEFCLPHILSKTLCPCLYM